MGNIKQSRLCDIWHLGGMVDKKMSGLILCARWGMRMGHTNFTSRTHHMGLQIVIAKPFSTLLMEMFLYNVFTLCHGAF